MIPLALLAATGGLLMYLAGSPRALLGDLAADDAWLRTLVQRWGAVSVLAYIAIYAALMTTLWVPAWLCSIVGGFIFGPWLGTACALVGATLGATSVFLLARRGLDGVAVHWGSLARRLETRFLAGGFSYLVMVRLIPIFPFSVVNVVAATTRLSLTSYVAATALGIVPSTLIYASLGSGLSESLETDEFLRPGLLLPLACLAALVLITLLYRLRCRR